MPEQAIEEDSEESWALFAEFVHQILVVRKERIASIIIAMQVSTDREQVLQDEFRDGMLSIVQRPVQRRNGNAVDFDAAQPLGAIFPGRHVDCNSHGLCIPIHQRIGDGVATHIEPTRNTVGSAFPHLLPRTLCTLIPVVFKQLFEHGNQRCAKRRQILSTNSVANVPHCELKELFEKGLGILDAHHQHRYDVVQDRAPPFQGTAEDVRLLRRLVVELCPKALPKRFDVGDLLDSVPVCDDDVIQACL
mmetsp:Transcript_50522/g.81642  ORF Transcript_50522/g.81642 Transcript_50522/m.81642 type:complete len:248 (-) Transcript_50522:2003-2746(-)